MTPITGLIKPIPLWFDSPCLQILNDTHVPRTCLIVSQIVLNENALLEELSVEYVPQIGFLTTLHERFGDLVPEDFSFAFAQVHVRVPLAHTFLCG